ncbi:uncharacterized protein LOC118755658 [Rhagoletis pomonella]|uniref:uncharacterized protein LOC118755658 n=1 Tax=Rhagoletis pomonella TaxID=28610 RepID=UPI00178474CC|nr:uncharacterized protein LOC118755658 [Rhagoletis pomonella]
MSDIEQEDTRVQTPLYRESREVRVKKSQRLSLLNRLKALEIPSVQLSALSAPHIEAKLALIERYYNSFEELQTQLEILDDTELDEEHRLTMDESYCRAKALYSERLSFLRTNSSGMQLSSTHITQQHNTSSSRQRINLPKLKLSTFNGCYREWLDFYNIFLVLVDKNPDLSDIEKFQYLRSSLSGCAATLIQSLEVTNANYKKPLQLLESRFDHKRYILQSHLQHIFDTQRITTPTVANLRSFVDVINANMRAMQSMATSTQIGNGLLLHLVVSKLDHETQVKWEEEVAAKWDRPSHQVSLMLPAWEDLAAFLERRCQLIDIIDHSATSTKSSHRSPEPTSSSQSKSRQSPKQVSFITTNKPKCNLCEGSISHNAFNCSVFMKLTPVQRYDVAKKKSLCLNCLGPNHSSKDCPSTHRCQVCRASHHTLLHRSQPTTTNPQSSSSPLTPSNTMKSTSTPTVLQVCDSNKEVLLATAVIQLRSQSGTTIFARALLDSASQLHFITERLAQLLRVHRKKVPLEISGIGLCGSRSQFLCKVEIRSQHTAYSSTIDAVIMNAITTCQPRTPLNTIAWNIPKNINLADDNFNKPGPVDLLLGASIFYDLLLIGQIKLGDNVPVLQKTKVGWVVAGAVTIPPLISSASLVASYTTSVGTDCILSNAWPSQISFDSKVTEASSLTLEPSLDQILERFWLIEHNPHQTPPSLTADEIECEKFFAETTKRCPNTNKFIVRLPFKESP